MSSSLYLWIDLSCFEPINSARDAAQISIEEVVALAAALEAYSEHPLAAAIIAFAAARLGVAEKAPETASKKASDLVGKGSNDGGGAARRVDWVRPAKDVEAEPGASQSPAGAAARQPEQHSLSGFAGRVM